MSADRCLLLAPTQHRLFERAQRIVADAISVVRVVDDEDPAWSEAEIARGGGLVLSFLNRKLLRGPLLACPNVNFHPASPDYPGRGGASYALFEGATTYGATAHAMIRDVDAGPILAVEEFSIDPDDGCEHVFARAEEACLLLLERIVRQVAATGALPEPCGRSWGRKAIRRAEFERWMVLDPADRETFVRKVKALRHSRYPGPYLNVHGHRFVLDPKRSGDENSG